MMGRIPPPRFRNETGLPEELVAVVELGAVASACDLGSAPPPPSPPTARG